jgi:hypothetical protein
MTRIIIIKSVTRFGSRGVCFLRPLLFLELINIFLEANTKWHCIKLFNKYETHQRTYKKFLDF